MRRILGIFLVLHFAGYALAQEVNLNQAEPDTTGYYIKLPYEEVNDKLIVKAEVGGKQRRFIFDTGSITCISQTLADELNLSDKENVNVVDQSGRQSATSIIVIDRITFDSTAFRNVPALAFEKSVFFDCFNVDGFIGSNLFHKSIVQFSPEDTTIIITDQVDSLNLNKKYATKLYLDEQQSNPYFIIKFGNTKQKLLFDSGSNGLISMNIDEYEKLKDRKIFRILGNTYGNASIGMFGVAENVEMYRLYLARFFIGKNKMANAIIHTTEGESRMGVKLTDHGIVTIDYLNKQFYFEPYDTYKVYTNVRERFWTVSPSIQDGKLIIGTVWDDLGQNINQGDLIIAINGISYRQRSECEILLHPLINSEDREEAVLTIENTNGTRRNVKIIKQ